MVDNLILFTIHIFICVNLSTNSNMNKRLLVILALFLLNRGITTFYTYETSNAVTFVTGRYTTNENLPKKPLFYKILFILTKPSSLNRWFNIPILTTFTNYVLLFICTFCIFRLQLRYHPLGITLNIFYRFNISI